MALTDSEDADIARIAALRGRSANYYAELRRGLGERLSDQVVGGVYAMGQDWRADLAHFDDLPEASRAFVRESVMPLNAIRYDAVLEAAGGDEETIMRRLAVMAAAVARSWVLRHYGSDHPSVRKYG